MASKNKEIQQEEQAWRLPAIENWQMYSDGAEPAGAFECVLYTDVHILGQVEDECGPYHFLNTIPITGRPGAVLPYVVLRCFYFEKEAKEPPDFRQKSDSSKYHGGASLIDELAAFSSLLLGARIKASEVTRDFQDLKNEPMGRPTHWGRRNTPTISFDSGRPILPCATGQRNLSTLHDLSNILALNGPESVALVRAARLYQDALWIGETDPNLTWIMLVSALESIADCWRKNLMSNREILQETLPVLVEHLEAEDGGQFIDRIADDLAHLTGSIKKFLGFCLDFLPDPPESRPSEFLQIKWTDEEWKRILKIIYNYRSKALHESIPFPLPMGNAPFYHKKGDAPAEKGTIGLAASQANARWQAKDLPVNLNLFAIVTRQILLNWLMHLAEERKEPR